MKTLLPKLTSLLLISCCLVMSCQKPTNREPQPPAVAQKTILSFDLKKTDNPSLQADVTGVIGSDSVLLILPVGSVLGSYVPTITFKGNSIRPNNLTPQDFANPIKYTVSAQDGSTKNYVVLAKVQLRSDKVITSFQLKAADNAGKVASDITATITGDEINLTVPTGTNLSSLIPTITINGKSVSPASSLSQDFTGPVRYTVTAQDGTSRVYTVRVVRAPLTATVYMKSKWWYGAPPVTGKFFAFDAETGVVKWLHETEPSPPVFSSGTYVAGIIYTAIGPDLVALDAQTGVVKRTYALPASISSTPTIVNGIIYANCNDHTLYAVNAETRAILWSFVQDRLEVNWANYCNPTVVDGVVYFGNNYRHFYAVNAETGALKWKLTSNESTPTGDFKTNPAVWDGVVYIGDTYSNFFAFDAATGKELWRYHLGSGGPSSATVENGIVYFGTSFTNTLYALDAKTGKPKWGYGAGNEIIIGPVVEDGVVYVGTDGAGVHAVDAVTGVKKWQALNNYIIKGAPVVFNGNVYVGSGAAFYALSAATGAIKWHYTQASNMNTFGYTSPFVVDVNGKAYYPTNSGHRQ